MENTNTRPHAGSKENISYYDHWECIFLPDMCHTILDFVMIHQNSFWGKHQWNRAVIEFNDPVCYLWLGGSDENNIPIRVFTNTQN